MVSLVSLILPVEHILANFSLVQHDNLTTIDAQYSQSALGSHIESVLVKCVLVKCVLVSSCYTIHISIFGDLYFVLYVVGYPSALVWHTLYFRNDVVILN